ncbi:hypothetical protein WL36_21945 [Burkholderia ubonensis]|nr:hypothetical protein WL36_21945 [Burkholderia ubonensis]
MLRLSEHLRRIENDDIRLIALARIDRFEAIHWQVGPEVPVIRQAFVDNPKVLSIKVDIIRASTHREDDAVNGFFLYVAPVILRFESLIE